MPPRRSGLRCNHIFTLIAVVLLVPAGAAAQTGGVTLRGTVSETVTLSVLPNLPHGNVDSNAVSSGNTVRITLSGADSKDPVIRVPLLVRSNSGFKIAAAFESQTAELTQLSVIDVHATGTLVSSHAVNALEVTPRFDRRGLNAAAPNRTDISQPLLVLSGPRISLGGTLESPNNALQVTLLIRLQPQPARGWLAHLTFVATPESLIQ